MSAPATTNDRAYTRRDLTLLAFAGLTTLPWGRTAGVSLSVHASSFRDLSAGAGADAADRLIGALRECGAGECEISPAIVEPAAFAGHAGAHAHSIGAMTPQMMRRELRKWRLRTPTTYFASIGERFTRAGIRLYAYNYSPDATFSDEEIDRGFVMARAMGAEILTASSGEGIARRIARFADRHQMPVAFAGQAEMRLSPLFKLHVDVGQLIASGTDPVAYLRDHHREIASLYLTDCKKATGEVVTWGRGDVPIRQLLQMLRDEGWPIHACVKYQDGGTGRAVDEVRRCFAYAKQALA